MYIAIKEIIGAIPESSYKIGEVMRSPTQRMIELGLVELKNETLEILLDESSNINVEHEVKEEPKKTKKTRRRKSA